ncbi:hypothetical protein [Rhizobium sp. CECT 9324]|uniref:hypothetical protein n=1 Tax=Rhizobium sp. CECT 9324 TaxID=2845820 RepID=UPI001E41E0B2|nr:hypothetical protein [Rhizobium sp. CECT 9324]CAH0339541.1 hypothetical protein RHI9324_01190 [Rhizobium sp. CECT 9324]
MVEIYAAMAFELMRERHAASPRLREEAFYQAYREGWWGRLRKTWFAKRQTDELAQAECGWCRDGQPAE